MAYNVTSSQYTKTYTSFSGCDIVATFGNVVIGELQAISFSVSREKAPLYTMGSAEPRSFTRGKRGIAGTLIFSNFDRDALIYALKEWAAGQAYFQRLGGELPMEPLSVSDWDRKMNTLATNQMSNINGEANAQTIGDSASIDNGNVSVAASTNDRISTITSNFAVASTPHYGDEIPPFDITLSFCNEYGQEAYMCIYGVEILNEGSGFSIDSLVSEKACTFVARRLDHLTPIEDSTVNNGVSKTANAVTKGANTVATIANALGATSVAKAANKVAGISSAISGAATNITSVSKSKP